MKLGVIGGLGPMASAYFYELLVSMTAVTRDQEHLEIIIYNSPNIPDRTAYLLNKTNNNPIPHIVDIAKKLEEQVDYIAIPCITAHAFYDMVAKQIKIPIINMLDELADYLTENRINKVGILATDGTLKSKIFQQKLEYLGIRCLLPDIEFQQELMCLIYNDIKSGKEIDKIKFDEITNNLYNKGVSDIILGCTELSLINKQYRVKGIDMMELLARRSLLNCNKNLSHFVYNGGINHE